MKRLEDRKLHGSSETETFMLRPASRWRRGILTAAVAVGALMSAASFAQREDFVTFAKAFDPATIDAGGTSVLTFTVTNNNEIDVTALAFTDMLPAGVVVADPNGAMDTCGGTLTAVAGAGTISYSNGMIGPGFPATCTVSVNVTSASRGIYPNTTSELTSNSQTSPHAAASDTLTVVGPVLDVVPSSTEFGDVEVGMTDCAQVTIGNAGDGALNVTAVTILGANADQFAIQGFSGAMPPFMLAPMATNVMTVCFSPTTNGVKTADVDVTSNAPVVVAAANAKTIGSVNAVVASLMGTGVPAVPSAPQWALALLALALFGFGVARLRRRVGGLA